MANKGSHLPLTVTAGIEANKGMARAVGVESPLKIEIGLLLKVGSNHLDLELNLPLLELLPGILLHLLHSLRYFHCFNYDMLLFECTCRMTLIKNQILLIGASFRFYFFFCHISVTVRLNEQASKMRECLL